MEINARTLFWLVLGVAFAILFYFLSPILTPFLIAAFIAYLGDPIADRFERMGLTRTWSAVIVFLLFALLFLIVVLMLVPMIANQIEIFRAALPRYIDWFQQTAIPYVSGLLGADADLLGLGSVKELLNDNWQTASGVLKTLLAQLTKSGLVVAGWFASLVLIPVVAFYLLRDWDVLVSHIKDLLPRSQLQRTQLMAAECDEVLSAFLRGQLMIMLALSLIYAIGLAMVGLDLSLLIGLVAGLASVVPYLGAAVGIIAAMIAGAVQFQDIIHLVAIAVVFGVGQLVESLILTPLLVGDKIGLHPVAVIFAVMAGGQLFGFVGVLLALPVAAILVVLLRHAHRSYTNSIFYRPDATEQSER